MQYKTIALGLLTADPARDERLKASRLLTPTIHRLSAELKSRHLDWIDGLTRRSPTEDPERIRHQALELAIEELRARLSSSD